MIAKKPASKSAGKSSASAKGERPVLAFLEALASKEKRLAARLRSPASATALGALRGLELPTAMIALYTLHDGSDDAVFGPYQLLPTADVLDERAAMNEVLAENPAWLANRTWDARWVPFMADGDGQLFVIDPVGSTEGGLPGQVLFFDHELGPTREAASFEVLLDLMARLATKQLLGEEAWRERAEEVDALRTDARAIGLPRMKPADLRRLLSAADDDDLTPRTKLGALLAAAERHSGEAALWSRIASIATELSDFPLVVRASEAALGLEARPDKNAHVPALLRGLHELGRDDEAITVLRAGLARITNANERRSGLVPRELAPRFRLRALRVVTELQPRDVETWELLAKETDDGREREAAREQVITLVDGKEYPSSFDVKRRLEAIRAREHERIAPLSPEAQLTALLELASLAKDGEWDVAWEDAALLAARLGRWDVVDAASAKQIEHTYASLDAVCALRVRALFELGREDEALALVRDALSLAYSGGDSCFVAIPWQEERLRGTPVVEGAARAFQARAFAIVTELSPENFAAWKWRIAFATGRERDEVLQAVIARFGDEPQRRDEDGAFYHSDEDRADFTAVLAASRRELG